MIKLQIRDPNGNVREIETTESWVRLGRSPDSTVRLVSPDTAWSHGQIFERDGVAWYRDLNTESGTLVVGPSGEKRIKNSMHEVNVGIGDKLLVGDCEVTLVSLRSDPYSIVGGEEPFVQGKSSRDIEDLIRKLEKDQQVLKLIYKFEKRLSGSFDLEDILETISGAVFSVFDKATHLFVAFVEGSNIDVAFTRCRSNAEETEGPASLSRFIVTQVTESGQAISFYLAESGDLQIQQERKVAVDPTTSVRLNRIQSGICAPLWSGSSVIGVLEIDNRVEISAFNERERDLLVLFANRAAMALEKHQRHLADLQQTRDAAIGQVVNKVVHDLANHYTVLLPMTQMADMAIQNLEVLAGGEKPNTMKLLQNTAKLRECWQKISLHQDMVVGLIDDLRHFGKNRAPEYDLIPVEDLIGESIDMARFRAIDRKKNVTFRLDGNSNKVSVFGDRKGIRRVLQNLMNNSVDAIDRNSAGLIEVSSARVSDNGHEYVRILVRDSGCGIPPDLIDKIFQYGFTTKTGLSGSGFGLSIVMKVLSEHRGFARIASAKDKGTEVQIHFPAIKRAGQIKGYPERNENLVETFPWNGGC